MKIKPELYLVDIEGVTIWSCDSEEKLIKHVELFKQFDFIRMREVKYNPETTYYQVADSDKYTLSKEQILALLLVNIKVKILQTIDIKVDITQQLIDLAERPIRVALEGSSGDTYNTKCEVHMPGNLLALYNEVAIMEDCCTDILQSQLNAGWRIIAACPQGDSRRPDYVLGRFNPNYDPESSASRGEQ